METELRPFIFCGIDPGITGAIAFYRPDDERLVIYDMPTRPKGERREVCPNVSALYLSKFFPRFRGIAVVEKVASMPNDGGVQAFSLGRSFGVMLGVLASLQISVLEVRPSIWKGAMDLSRDKKESLALARKLFPRQRDYFALVKHNGRAEAALLAYYGQEIWDLGPVEGE